MTIKAIQARQILDSRGNPTIAVQMTTTKGVVHAMVPSGASTGTHEAVELRDKTEAYGGTEVKKAIGNIHNRIAPHLIGKDERNQEQLDNLMIDLDGTPNKSKLGANAILAVSMCISRAGALTKGKELYEHINDLYNSDKKRSAPRIPMPYANVINGGKHAPGRLAFQEFMITPKRATSFTKATRMVVETYHELKGLIHKKYGSTAVGDEGGFAPNIASPDEALDLLQAAIKKSGHAISFAMDAAASEFYENGNYVYEGKKHTSQELLELYKRLIRKYDVVSVEDPFFEDDFTSFAKLLKATKKQIVGDDLTVTNLVRLKKAVEERSISALLLKINQIGSITESILAAKYCFDHNIKVMVSHRSGETSDAFIADLATGIGCGQIKLGAPARSDRTAKYNRLLEIDETLKKH
ncbi:MAG: phosphopyruvate hydratase [Candidatus Woesearchaeota archaeon]|nr:MAG: phosphopyruvate hydratase [Candidatus Woesearchaeota archaeon]